MAEVKTYKCDICGEVYHVEDELNECVTIVHEICEEDGRDIDYYKHICPHCRGVILEIIRNPDAIEKMDARMDELSADASSKRTYSYRLENLIKELRDDICGWVCWYGEYDYDCLNIMSADIKREHNEVKSSRCRWRALALGLLTGMLIALMLKLIF